MPKYRSRSGSKDVLIKYNFLLIGVPSKLHLNCLIPPILTGYHL